MINPHVDENSITSEDSWLKKIINDFASFKADLEEEIEAANENEIISDLEPPQLDPRWGLDINSRLKGMRNSKWSLRSYHLLSR